MMTYRLTLSALLFTLILTAQVYSQWYTDPADPSFHFTLMQQPVLCGDGGNGAFFAAAFDTNAWIPWFGHVRSNGVLGFADEEVPGLLRLTEERFGIEPANGLTLIPSEPLGTVIVIGHRHNLQELDTLFQQPLRAGLLIAKLDSGGFAAFGRLVVEENADLIYRDSEHPGLTSSGPHQAVSDGEGGLHLLLSRRGDSFVDTVYYNHLDGDGQWTYELPGRQLLGALSPFVDLFTDGAGGALVLETFTEASPVFPEEIRLHRFDAHGQPLFDPDGVFLHENNFGIGVIPKVFMPGELLLQGRDDSGFGNYDHTLFKYDANGTPLWGESGRSLITDGQFAVNLIPDSLGGFFYSTRDLQTFGYDHFHRDSSNALLASSPDNPRDVLRRADHSGGGYSTNGTVASTGSDLTFALWRWNSDLQPVWAGDSVLIMDINVDAITSRAAWTITPDTAVIGMITTLFGASFFRVSPDGILGEPPSAAGQLPSLPSSIALHQNYPNPFNPTTTISFTLQATQHATLTVFDIAGREVATLVNRQLSAGEHAVEFNASTVASGVYFYRMDTGGFSLTRKMILLR